MRLLRGVAAFVCVAVLASLAAAASPEQADALTFPAWWRLKNKTGTTAEVSRVGEEIRKAWRSPTYDGPGPDESLFRKLLADPNVSDAQKAVIRQRLAQAGIGARLLPRLALIGSRVSIPLTIGMLGLTIYQTWGDDEQEVDLWIDSSVLGTDSLYNMDALPNASDVYWYQEGVYWERKIGGCPAGLGVAVCYELHLTTLYDWGAGHHSGSNFLEDSGVLEEFAMDSPYDDAHAAYGFADYVERCVVGDDCPDHPGWGNGLPAEAGREVLYAQNATLQALAAESDSVGLYVNGEDTLGYDTRGAYMTEGAMQAKITSGVREAGGSGDVITTITNDYTVPANAGTTINDVGGVAGAGDDACWQALVSYIATDGVELAWSEVQLACGFDEAVVDPTGPPAEPVLIPGPDTGETFAQYRARLRALGYLGHIFVDPRDYASDGFTAAYPGRVHSIFAPLDANGDFLADYYRWMDEDYVVWDGGTAGWQAYEGGDPAADGMTTVPVGKFAPIGVVYEQGDAASDATEGNAQQPAPDSGGFVPPSSECGGYLTADPDFGPLTGITLTGFPFGLFGWATWLLGVVDVEPVTPEFDFTLPFPAIFGLSDAHYVVELSAADAYMNTIRTILAFAMWAGFVWFLATSLLGLKGTGDPGASVDDAEVLG